MEVIHLEKEIKVCCVTATSFPEGVLEAHKKLRRLFPSETDRSFYGISCPDKEGNIIYKAATAETYEGEAKKYDCEAFTIKRGAFLSKLVPDWRKGENKVKDTFEELLSDPRIDKNGYCLEEYIGEHDMWCMVPLDNTLVLNHDKEKLFYEIENTFNGFYNSLSAFDNEQLNRVPFEGSWTAGQVAEHIIKSVGGLPDNHTKGCERPYDEKVQAVKKLFLDFSIKFKSPDFIIPEQTAHDRNTLLKTIKEIQTHLSEVANNSDLTALCLDFELPTFGYLTRYEWINFFVFHTQRHTRQLKHIYQSLKPSSGK